MKQILKTLLWIAFIEIIIVVALYLFGFRITYNPLLISDWTAIGATADWVSAIATIAIPIVVVLFEHKLDENKKQTEDANKALLEELKHFHSEYGEMMYALKNGEVVLNGGGAGDSSSNDDLSEERLLNYIRATMGTTAEAAAKYFDKSIDETVEVLDELFAHNKITISNNRGQKIYNYRLL